MNTLLLLVFLLGSCTALSAQTLRDQLEMADRQNWYLRASSGGNVLASGRVRHLDTATVTLGSAKISLSEISELGRLNIGGGWKAGAFLKSGQGILYLVFFWTFIPAILRCIEGLSFSRRATRNSPRNTLH